MKIVPLFFLLIACGTQELTQNQQETMYFPPIGSELWETKTPENLGWNTSALYDLYQFLETNNTKAFLMLHNGKIVVERYFHGHSASSNWYWASAGKTLTASLVGIAQSEGHLNIHHKTSQYLGVGWTSAPSAKEDLITIKHQLSMTTGLDDGVSNSDDFSPSKLLYKADAGTRWAYHNAPYTLLHEVVENATGSSFDAYFNTKIRNPIGMNGSWIWLGDNHVFFSTARSMARFGLLMLNGGKWENQTIIPQNYHHEMVNTSQHLNLSYGYLWWLNGKSSFMLPTTQMVFSGWLCPNAPADMYAAMGKNNQLLNVVPSKKLVVIRMGEEGNFGNSATFQNELWQRISAVLNQ